MSEMPKIKKETFVKKDNPFLTVLTRCYSRPTYLYLNKCSLLNQTDKDYEHHLLIDEIGQGIEGANKFFEHSKELVNVQYVFLLDDDNAITYDSFITDLKKIKREYNPDIIFFKKKQIIEYPTFKSWAIRPVEDHIDTSCFCVKKELYLEYIHNFSVPKKGDYNFIMSAYPKAKNVFWFDKMTNMAFRISNGRKEEEE
jgi:hypothetical protein